MWISAKLPTGLFFDLAQELAWLEIENNPVSNIIRSVLMSILYANGEIWQVDIHAGIVIF